MKFITIGAVLLLAAGMCLAAGGHGGFGGGHGIKQFGGGFSSVAFPFIPFGYHGARFLAKSKRQYRKANRYLGEVGQYGSGPGGYRGYHGGPQGQLGGFGGYNRGTYQGYAFSSKHGGHGGGYW